MKVRRQISEDVEPRIARIFTDRIKVGRIRNGTEGNEGNEGPYLHLLEIHS
jgi:hypothetical protein